jgi:alkanesulfonate monooxygenase SsuD/methylene tetrahydromethanopterin reductase-like flavin-dependent oxidoreductase (luciferase family)
MEFGIFSNGFRPHTSAARTYRLDIEEIVLADALGFRDAYISEHHGEPPYINRVDTIPAPEFMMCKLAALTGNIRMGAAVKLLHLHHPLDVAVQAAIVEHLVGKGRFIFGFGSGFPHPQFAEARGLTFEDRHARLRESLEIILKCWTEDEPFDLDGEHWTGRNLVALPKPLSRPHMPMATATDTPDMIELAAARGYALLCAFFESEAMLRGKADLYEQAGKAAGHADPRKMVAGSRAVYVAESEKEALAHLRPAVTHEVGFQAERGFLTALKRIYGVDVPNSSHALDVLVEAGIYVLGDPDNVAKKIRSYHEACGGFGSFLLVGGKNWTTKENRARSLRRFMEEVAPQLEDL